MTSPPVTCNATNGDMECILPDDHLGPHKSLLRREHEVNGEYGPYYTAVGWGWVHLPGHEPDDVSVSDLYGIFPEGTFERR